ncbi:MAG: hypothetical protein WBQ53_09350 [Methylocystis sp.]
MFFKKRVPVNNPVGVSWDDKIIEHIIASRSFSVQITSASKHLCFGSSSGSEPMSDKSKFEIGGVITSPKFILVELSFDQEDVEFPFGFWSYSNYTHNSGKGEIRVPLLELCLADQSHEIREALFEAHKAAMCAGQRYSFARFFKRKGDGVMSPKEREQNWSSESNYPLIGAIAYAELQSLQLPSWAYPFSDQRFSIENMPPWYDLKL